MAWRRMRQNLLTKIKQVELEKASKYRIESKHQKMLRFEQDLKNKIPVTVAPRTPLRFTKLGHQADSFDELARDFQISEKRVTIPLPSGTMHFTSPLPTHTLRRGKITEK